MQLPGLLFTDSDSVCLKMGSSEPKTGLWVQAVSGEVSAGSSSERMKRTR